MASYNRMDFWLVFIATSEFPTKSLHSRHRTWAPAADSANYLKCRLLHIIEGLSLKPPRLAQAAGLVRRGAFAEGADHGIPTMARRRDADALRVKAVETRAQIDVRLEAERVRGQTDLQVGMPKVSSCQLYI